MKRIDNSYIYNPYKEKQLASALEKGDSNAAIQISDSILSDVCSCEDKTKELLKIVCFDMMGTALRVADKLLFSSHEIIAHTDSLNTAIENVDVAQTKLLMEQILRYTCDNSHTKGSASVVEATAQYIKSNYANASLSIPVIAKQFNIHPNYLSSIFKSNTNSTIIEYLSQVRIASAKKYLTESDLTIKDIALKIGYNNSHTFTRIFKKFEGVTPSDYRKI
ncbi:MAG: helix-turn-helix transcriptional regulator [Ruminococcaceae bacterium]|nr:helix-turn-helix transcriptional regulator [Oscillospiraceae bacterium]